MSETQERIVKGAQIARPRFPQDEREKIAFRAMARGERPLGYIYFIQAEGGGPIKIGYTGTDDVSSRLKSLQTGNPAKLVEVYKFRVAAPDEKKVHRALAASRLIGEWFECSPKVVAFWDRLKTGGLGAALVHAYSDDTPEATG